MWLLSKLFFCHLPNNVWQKPFLVFAEFYAAGYKTSAAGLELVVFKRL